MKRKVKVKLTIEPRVSENFIKDDGKGKWMRREVLGEIGKWDSKVSFLGVVGFLYQKYDKLWKKYETTGKLGFREWIELFYTITALIQLKNGTRSCEAVKGFVMLVNQNKNEVEMKACKNGDVITIDKPKLVPLYVMQEVWKNVSQHYIKKGYDLDKIIYRLRRNYTQYIEDHPDWKEVINNSHALRYAFIRRMSDEGVPADVIARMIGHKKLDTTYRYQKKYEAEKWKKEIMRDI